MVEASLKSVAGGVLPEGYEAAGIHVDDVRADMVFATVPKEKLPEVARQLHENLNARFITTVGTDAREVSGAFEVTHLFGLDKEQLFLILRSDVSAADPTIPSVTQSITGAGWAEREVRDLLGLTPVGNPDLRRLVLPDDWPDGVYPLRKEFRVDERPPSVPANKVKMNEPPADASVLPLGPFFPTLEEPVFINLFVHGEEIVGMDYRGFYSHRGIEKLADSDLTYQQIPHIAERICGI
jgi:Ni,Fe-hydrogenase III component G